MAHPKHQWVRVRYNHCCGYCGISETDAGGELTVDHYDPVSAGGDDRDDNLVYACFRCNLYKSDLLPENASRPPEQRLLHPLRDTLSDHLREDRQTGRLEALTITGAFHIASLRLNRAELIANRKRRQQYASLLAEVDQSYAEVAENDAVQLLRDAYIRVLKAQQARESKQNKEED